jgi:hypothetical protein
LVITEYIGNAHDASSKNFVYSSLVVPTQIFEVVRERENILIYVVVEGQPLLANIRVPLMLLYLPKDILENGQHLVISSYFQAQGLAVDS